MTGSANDNAGMKQRIAEAAAACVLKGNGKRLTVKDIVAECGITRQAFYYHFRDITEMMKWIIERESDRLIESMSGDCEPDERLKKFFRTAVGMAPYVRRGHRTGYGEELERLLEAAILRMFDEMTRAEGLYSGCSYRERELVLKYHSNAVLGLLKGWTDDDTRDLDMVVHQVYCLITGTDRRYFIDAGKDGG